MPKRSANGYYLAITRIYSPFKSESQEAIQRVDNLHRVFSVTLKYTKCKYEQCVMQA